MSEEPKSIAQETLETVVELRTAVLGAKNSADTGMAGALQRVGAQVSENAGAIQRLCALHQAGNEHMTGASSSRKKKAGWIGAIGALIAGAITAAIQAIRNNPQ